MSLQVSPCGTHYWGGGVWRRHLWSHRGHISRLLGQEAGEGRDGGKERLHRNLQTFGRAAWQACWDCLHFVGFLAHGFDACYRWLPWEGVYVDAVSGRALRAFSREVQSSP